MGATDDSISHALLQLQVVLQQTARKAGTVHPSLDVDALRRKLQLDFSFEQPHAVAELMRVAVPWLQQGTVSPSHPRHLGYCNVAPHAASVVGDALAASLNPQLSLYDAAPAVLEIERHTLTMLAARLGITQAGSHAFTTGGAESNLTSLLMAMARKFPNWADEGVLGLGARPMVYVSSETHRSVHKAVRVLGLGQASLHEVQSNSQLQLDPDALQRAIERDRAEGRIPWVVVATMGSTSAGVLDPLPELEAVCRREDLWLHVDAAWAGIAAMSDRTRPWLAGIDRADSITWDAHKSMGISLGAGMVFCRHEGLNAAAFGVDAPYMARGGVHAHPYGSTLQWSRRAMGLKVFLTLATRGVVDIARGWEQQCALGEQLREGLQQQGWLLRNSTPLPVVCARHPVLDDKGHRKLVRSLRTQYQTWIATTTVRDECVVRLGISNEVTTRADVADVLQQIQSLMP